MFKGQGQNETKYGQKSHGLRGHCLSDEGIAVDGLLSTIIWFIIKFILLMQF